MRRKLILLLLAALLVTGLFQQTFADDKSNKNAMTESLIKRRVLEAEVTDKRLIVGLKNGKSVSGNVEWISNKEFLVKHADNSFIVFGDEETIQFADVVYVKDRNPFVKALKKIGEYTGKTVGIIAISPFLAFMYGYSYLVFGEPPPDC